MLRSLVGSEMCIRDSINVRPVADGIPEVERFLINSTIGTLVNNTTTAPQPDVEFEARAENTYMDQTVAKRYTGPCLPTGDDLGAGVARIRCDQVLIIATSALVNSEQINSEQNQGFEIESLILDD